MNVFDAVADPTRRQLLESLRTQGPATLTDLAGGFSMSRQAVTKHLDLLTQAGLVRIRREGRTRVHELDSFPLQALELWLEPYAAQWDRRLDRLKRHLEE